MGVLSVACPGRLLKINSFSIHTYTGNSKMARDNSGAEDGVLVYDGENDNGTEWDALLGSMQDSDNIPEVLLYRQKSKNHKDGLIICESWAADSITWAGIQKAAFEFIPDKTRDTYFRVNVRQHGKLVAGGNRPFEISGRSAGAGNTPVFRESGNNQNEILRAILESNQAATQQLIAAMNNKPDSRAEMLANLEMMKAMREAMGVQAPVNTAPVTPLTMMQETMAMFTGMMGLQKTMADMIQPQESSGDGDSWVGLIREAMPLLEDVLKNEQEIRAVETVADTVAKVPPIIQRNPAPRAAPAGTAPLNPLVKAFFDGLQAKAASDVDPDEVARELLASKNVRPLLEKMAGDERPFKTLAAKYPPCLDYPDWWLDLIAAIQDGLTPPDETDKDGTEFAGVDIENHGDVEPDITP